MVAYAVEQSFVKQQAMKSISFSCYQIATDFWNQAKAVLKASLLFTPFVYFSKRQNQFFLSDGKQSDELYNLLDSQDEEPDADKFIVIYPSKFQELYDKGYSDEYARHQISKELESVSYLNRKRVEERETYSLYLGERKLQEISFVKS